MQLTISFMLCMFVIILSVQARSIESDFEDEMSNKQLSPEQYRKLLTYLTQQETDSRSNDPSSSSTEEIKQLPKREFFLFPSRRANQKYRPTQHTYGRKSHWDTFFG